MLSEIFLKRIIYLVISLFFIVTFIFIFTEDIEFDNKLSYVDIISIFINILLVYYLSYFLNKKDSIAKAEKDLLIKYLEEFQTKKNQLVNSINSTYDYNNVAEVQTLISNLKILRTELKLKLDLLVDNKYIENNSDLYTNTNTVMRNIWKYLTYTPSVRDTNFNREVYINNARTNSSLLDKYLFNIIKKINAK